MLIVRQEPNMFTSLRLERFKNFKDAELKLGPFTVLIGANASGKSNIRDAFRFLHGISRGYSLADIIGEKYGEGGERIWSGIRGGAREITFSGNRTFVLTSQSIVSSGVKPLSHDRDYGGEALHYQIGVEIKQKELIPQVMLESLDICDGLNLFLSRSKDRHYHQAKLYNTSTKFKPVGPYTLPRTIPFLGQMPAELRNWPFGSQFVMINESRDRYLTDHFSEFCQELDDVLTIFRSNRFFDWSLDALRQPSMPGQEVLSDNGRNLSSVLLSICEDAQSKQILLSWVHELTPMDVVDLEFPADPAGRVLATLIERNKQKTTLASASDGTLRFLAFLASFLGPETPSFYFFEELENGIHPTRLNLLVDLIENQVKNKKIQVVATTHSPQLLGRLSKESLEDASLVYRLPDQPDARIIPVLEMPHAKRLIKKQKLAHLFASGWFETTAHFMQPDLDDSNALANSGPDRTASPFA
jgi:predicted ATPase